MVTKTQRELLQGQLATIRRRLMARQRTINKLEKNQSHDIDQFSATMKQLVDALWAEGGVKLLVSRAERPLDRKGLPTPKTDEVVLAILRKNGQARYEHLTDKHYPNARRAILSCGQDDETVIHVALAIGLLSPGQEVIFEAEVSTARPPQDRSLINLWRYQDR